MTINKSDILEYGMTINELANKGVKEIPIEEYQHLLNAYIDILFLLDDGDDNFNRVMDLYNNKMK